MSTMLEQSFADLCAEHDLTAISICYNHGGGLRFSSFVHGGGECSVCHGDTIAQAIHAAIVGLAARRTAPGQLLADEPLLAS